MKSAKGFFKRVSLLLMLTFICGVILITTQVEAVTFEEAQEYGKRISAGFYHSLGLTSDGKVLIWGQNDVNRNGEVPEGINNAAILQGCLFKSAVLQSDRTALLWGGGIGTWHFDNGGDSLPDEYQGRVMDIACDSTGIYLLLSDGTVAGGNYEDTIGTKLILSNDKKLLPEVNSNFIAIEAGQNHKVGLKTNGKVVIWGSDDLYNQSMVPAGLNDPIAISATNNANHTLALKSNGTIVAWGWNTFDQCKIPVGLSNVVAISAGQRHSLALRGDGTVVAWGDNNKGQCDVPEGLNDVVAIAAGGEHSLALRSNGAIVAWGNNDYGQCDVPVEFVIISPSQEEEPISNIKIRSSEEVNKTKCILNSSFISKVSFDLDETVNSAKLEFILPSNVSMNYVMHVKKNGENFDLTKTTIQDNKLIISQEGQALTPGNYEMQILMLCTNIFKINTKSFGDGTGDGTGVTNYRSAPLTIEAKEPPQIL